MTIRLLENVANDLKGTVLTVSEDRAKRLIRTGYAVIEVVQRKEKRDGTRPLNHPE